jgi:hypothetical protein
MTHRMWDIFALCFEYKIWRDVEVGYSGSQPQRLYIVIKARKSWGSAKGTLVLFTVTLHQCLYI